MNGTGGLGSALLSLAFFYATLFFFLCAMDFFFWRSIKSVQGDFFLPWAVSSRSSTKYGPFDVLMRCEIGSFFVSDMSPVSEDGGERYGRAEPKGRTPRDEAAVTESHFGLDYIC